MFEGAGALRSADRKELRFGASVLLRVVLPVFSLCAGCFMIIVAVLHMRAAHQLAEAAHVPDAQILQLWSDPVPLDRSFDGAVLEIIKDLSPVPFELLWGLVLLALGYDFHRRGRLYRRLLTALDASNPPGDGAKAA